MIKVLLHGFNGKMGQMVEAVVKSSEGVEIVAGVDQISQVARTVYPTYSDINLCEDKVDAIIDFSNASATESVLEYANHNQIPLVLCTTGLSKEQIAKVEGYSQNIPILRSSNMSLGINAISVILEQMANVLYESNFDIEIIEKHHNQKVDAPSGSAILLADSINKNIKDELKYVYERKSVEEKRTKNEIGIHSIRGGNLAGQHSVMFVGNDEVIEITHTALSRKIFAEGAVKAVKFIVTKSNGLYSMKDVIKN